jgi:hypothetical protein
VFATEFEAVTPVAELAPELAVVTPWAGTGEPPTVGPSATLRPAVEDAALESEMVVVCSLATRKAPEPPPVEPALSWVLSVLVCA